MDKHFRIQNYSLSQRVKVFRRLSQKNDNAKKQIFLISLIKAYYQQFSCIPLIVNYIRQMNSIKYQHNPLSRIGSTLTAKPQQSKEILPVQTHKTERKNSMGTRVGLTEFDINRSEFNSNSKGQSYRTSRQVSIQLCKHKEKMECSNVLGKNSRWLDNDKDMMEFIQNLKLKKSEHKIKTNKKDTQGFQYEEKIDQKQALCNRMLIIKKVEKYEKEAISFFYEKQYNKAFAELSKAESLLKKEKIESHQHNLYINYLYAEFYYKHEKYEKLKIYLNKAKSFISRVDNTQNSSMREYIMNVKALDICMSLHEQKYDKVLFLVDQLNQEDHVSSKIRRRISNAQIIALRKMCRYKEALKAIDNECETLEHDPEVNQEKKDTEFAKFFQLKVEITTQFVSTEQGISLIEKLINFQEVSNGQRDNFGYYNVKIYKLFSELLKKIQSQKVKLIFFFQKWLQIEQSKKERLKISLELFRMFYEMGIYERALELFDSISSQNVVYLGPEYLYMFANIKHFNGEVKEAISIVSKSIEICEDDQTRALYMFRLLEFELEEEGTDFRAEREDVLQNLLRKAEGAQVQHVSELYVEYLRDRNQYERLSCFVNMMKKTAQFNGFQLKDSKSGKKSTWKH